MWILAARASNDLCLRRIEFCSRIKNTYLPISAPVVTQIGLGAMAPIFFVAVVADDPGLIFVLELSQRLTRALPNRIRTYSVCFIDLYVSFALGWRATIACFVGVRTLLQIDQLHHGGQAVQLPRHPRQIRKTSRGQTLPSPLYGNPP